MNPMVAQQFLGQVVRRQRVVAIARKWRFILVIALVGYTLALLVSRLLGLIPSWFTLATLAAFPVVTLVLAWTFYRRPTVPEAARLADAKMGTHDLFLTASRIEHSLGAYQELVLVQAGERAARMVPRQVVPFRWGRDAFRLGAALVVLGLGVYFLPQLDPFRLHQQQRQLAEQHERVREMKKATELRAMLLEQKRAGEQTDAVKQAVANLEQVFKEAKPADKANTLARLNEQQKVLGQLWKQASEEKLKNGLAVPPPTQSFGLSDPTKTSQIKNDLEKGDVSSAQKELSDLAKKAQELAATKDPVEREKLRQELMDRMQSLKDALDQQLNSQAVDSDLQRALEQLAMSNAPELSGESLKGASDSMKLTADELKELAKAMADMKNLEEALKALQLAKALHGMKPLDGQDYAKFGDLAAYASFCQGECEGLVPGMGLGEGKGLGPRPHGDDSLASNFQPGKAPSPLQPGRMLMEWKTREVSEAGPAREEYLRAVQDVRQQASEAVVEEQIPPGYQAAIKKYFDTLHNDSSANTHP
jgi:hypothetical protein